MTKVPEWCDLPVLLKRAIVTKLDWKSRLNLKVCSKDCENLVDSVEYHWKDISYSCDGDTNIVIKYDGENEKFIQKGGRTILIKNGKTEYMYYDDMMLLASKRLNRILRNNTVEKLKIETYSMHQYLFPLFNMKHLKSINIGNYACYNEEKDIRWFQTFLDKLPSDMNYIAYTCCASSFPVFKWFKALKTCKEVFLRNIDMEDKDFDGLQAESCCVFAKNITIGAALRYLKTRSTKGNFQFNFCDNRMRKSVFIAKFDEVVGDAFEGFLINREAADDVRVDMRNGWKMRIQLGRDELMAWIDR